MQQLDLSPEEATILREVVNTSVSDLGMEIAGTDSHDFRENLKRRREVLRRIAAQLNTDSVT